MNRAEGERYCLEKLRLAGPARGLSALETFPTGLSLRTGQRNGRQVYCKTSAHAGFGVQVEGAFGFTCEALHNIQT